MLSEESLNGDIKLENLADLKTHTQKDVAEDENAAINYTITETENDSEKKSESEPKQDSSDTEKDNESFDSLQKDLDDEDENSDTSQQDYSNFKKEELLTTLRDLINEKPAESIKNDVDIIKTCFYKIIKSEKDIIRQKLTESGAEENIEIPKDPAEDYFKELLTDYKNKKGIYLAEQEKEKEKNLKQKEEIIEKIKILANGEESLNKTFSEFKDLQKKWTDIGPVPAAESAKLWNNYQLQIERFYDFIKINKELRDLDLKKNLENKIELCEKTEDLLLEKDVKKAYNKLQEYHEQWKDIGPVEIEKREEIWERFSEVTKKIRSAYQEYFIELRKEREDNLKPKTALCEKIEIINTEEQPKNRKEWVEKSKEILEIQKIWKTIGMVPKENNESIYERFRAACNKFFEDKKEFFEVINAEVKQNLQQKTDICIQAESIKDSTDWKKTSELFFDLQKKWKDIGPVPPKQSDLIWKRFRAACDYFFNAKDQFFNNIGDQQKDNLKIKKEIIESLKDFKTLDNQAENIQLIKEIQNKWIATGNVPIKQKDKMQDEYKTALSELYDRINLSRKEVDSHNYKSRVESLKSSDDIKQLSFERSKITQKIKSIEDDIRLWENNMTFFAGSAKDLLADFTEKVNKAREEVEVLNTRKKMLDLALRDIKKSNDEKHNND
jgi:hypothetical protein